MRLIDGTALYMHLNNWALAEAPTELDVGEMKFEREVIYKTILDCMRVVDEQPTAYDAEKVVNDLEYASYCKSTPTFDRPYTDSIIDLEEAMDIVKRGGLDDK